MRTSYLCQGFFCPFLIFAAYIFKCSIYSIKFYLMHSLLECSLLYNWKGHYYMAILWIYRPLYLVDTVQDFLIELDMKPCMHLVEISIFSLNNVTVRLTKIMNNFLEHLKIRIFKVISQCWKLVESFLKKKSVKNNRDKVLLKKYWKIWFFKYFIF